MQTDETTVIKRINKANAINTGMTLDVIKNEIAILDYLGKICRPYILCFRAFAETPDHYYVITDYLRGWNMYDFIRDIPLTPNQKKSIMNKLRLGLQTIHAAGVAHRDIKPDNIMLDVETLTPTYIDFGLACEGKTCQTDKAVGTPQYQAPEIYKGIFSNIQYDLPSLQLADIWSLGLTEFYLIRGEDYWELWYKANNKTGDYIVAIYESIVTPDPLNLTSYLPATIQKDYPEITVALEAACQKNPGDRQLLPV